MSLTLKQAKEWYNGDNEALKELALSVFTEEELKISYAFILNNIVAHIHSAPVGLGLKSKVNAFIRLCNMAEYFNKGWKKVDGESGYFISKLTRPRYEPVIGVQEHKLSTQVGLVYFKNRKDAEQALELMGGSIECFFD